jgi:hypothetical protein
MCIVAHSNNSLKLTFILGVQPSHPSILGKYLLSLIPGVACRALGAWVDARTERDTAGGLTLLRDTNLLSDPLTAVVCTCRCATLLWTVYLWLIDMKQKLYHFVALPVSACYVVCIASSS